uniref:Uncharacterized protein n=1 Tax=Anguilla anguilla TaxID=7936 RepID=A0A0E9U0T2_ANGAN
MCESSYAEMMAWVDKEDWAGLGWKD